MSPFTAAMIHSYSLCTYACTQPCGCRPDRNRAHTKYNPDGRRKSRGQLPNINFPSVAVIALCHLMALYKWAQLSWGRLWFLITQQWWTLFGTKSDQHSTRHRHGWSRTQPKAPYLYRQAVGSLWAIMSSQELIWLDSSGRLCSGKTAERKGGVLISFLCYLDQMELQCETLWRSGRNERLLQAFHSLKMTRR